MTRLWYFERILWQPKHGDFCGIFWKPPNLSRNCCGYLLVIYFCPFKQQEYHLTTIKCPLLGFKVMTSWILKYSDFKVWRPSLLLNKETASPATIRNAQFWVRTYVSGKDKRERKSNSEQNREKDRKRVSIRKRV